MEIMQVVFNSYYLQWMVNFPELLAQFLHHPDMEEEMPNVTEFVEPTHQILEERKLSDITSQPQYLT